MVVGYSQKSATCCPPLVVIVVVTVAVVGVVLDLDVGSCSLSFFRRSFNVV